MAETVGERMTGGSATMRFRVRMVIGRTVCRVRGHRPVLMGETYHVASSTPEVIGTQTIRGVTRRLRGVRSEVRSEVGAGCRWCWTRVGD